MVWHIDVVVPAPRYPFPSSGGWDDLDSGDESKQHRGITGRGGDRLIADKVQYTYLPRLTRKRLGLLLPLLAWEGLLG